MDNNGLEQFNYQVDRFADIQILRYKVPGFENLSLKQKKLTYYLSQAALSGRDILFDQHCKCNLLIRKTLEAVLQSYKGNREDKGFIEFVEFTKRIWFSNGIHHHYSLDKIQPGFSQNFFRLLIKSSDLNLIPLREKETVDGFLNYIVPLIFNPEVYPKRIIKNNAGDMIVDSPVNFYENVNQEEVEQFYQQKMNEDPGSTVSHGLNSKLLKDNGTITEKVYKINGLYSAAIEKIVYWLKKAYHVAENKVQKECIHHLANYYNTGNLREWDEYNITWLQDLHAVVDFINGFVETYADPLGMKGTWEALVNFKDLEATKRTEIISSNAQWFEDHSPVDERFKKEKVKGVSAKVITAVQLGGDCYPTTPIGINLPNADWIRKEYGSKSVTIGNITEAYYANSLHDGFYEEFLADEEELRLIKKYGALTNNLHVDLHECLGHGSGQLLPGVSTEALKEYHAPLEEARADLFALYYLMDPKMVELGLLPVPEAAKAAYIDYVQNGIMTQLKRIQPGKDIEQAHMRCRQLITKWCYQQGEKENVIVKFTRENKTFFKIHDFVALRKLFGKLLHEVQRIKSEGDYQTGKKLVEEYGIKCSRKLHEEVLRRYEKLNLAPYTGFINPILEPVTKGEEIIDIRINHETSYYDQMMHYSRSYSFLTAFMNKK